MGPQAKALLNGLLGSALSYGALTIFPELEIELFARTAAEAASLFTGAPVLADPTGWLLPHAGVELLVSEACSGTDFFVMLVALLCWRFTARTHTGTAIALGLALGLAGSLAVNSLRVILVAQTSRLQLALLPEDYQSFAHLLLGITVFLPALVLVNLIFDAYDRSDTARSPTAPN